MKRHGDGRPKAARWYQSTIRTRRDARIGRGHDAVAADARTPPSPGPTGVDRFGELIERMFGSGRRGADEQPAVCDAGAGAAVATIARSRRRRRLRTAAEPTARPMAKRHAQRHGAGSLR